jgi:hypothetical protein
VKEWQGRVIHHPPAAAAAARASAAIAELQVRLLFIVTSMHLVDVIFMYVIFVSIG